MEQGRAAPVRTRRTVSNSVGWVASWLRANRLGLFCVAIVVGVGAGLGAVAFRYLVFGFTWLATGHDEFGQQGWAASDHLPWLGIGFMRSSPSSVGYCTGH